MYKKFFSMVLMFACLCIVFSSCEGKQENISNIVATEYKSEASDIAMLSTVNYSNCMEFESIGYSLHLSKGNIAVFTKSESYYNNNYFVYNFKTDTSLGIFTYGNNNEQYDFTLLDYDNYIVRKYSSYGTTDTEFTLYNSKGEVLLNNKIGISGSGDTVIVNSVAYELSPEGIIPENNTSVMNKTVLSYTYETDNYYQKISNKSITIFDKDELPVLNYTIPSYADSYKIFSLNNGNILAQYLQEVKQIEGIEIKSKEYDYEVDNKKYKVTTLILVAKTAEIKELNIEYVFASASSKSTLETEGYTLTDKAENIATAYKITEKKIDINNDILCTLSDSGRIQPIDLWIAGQDSIPKLVADNRYTVSTKNGRTYLFNEQEKIIGDVTGSTLYDDYIVSATAVYDYNGNVLYNTNTIDKNLIVYTANSNYILFSKINENNWGSLYSNYILYQNGNEKTLPVLSIQSVTDRYIIGKNSNGVTYLFNSSGETIKEFPKTVSIVATFDLGILLLSDGIYYVVK